MINVEEAEREEVALPFEPERIRMAFLKAASELSVKVKGRMTENITKFLSAWKPSEAALTRYPFLQDIPKFIQDYTSCIEVNIEIDENAVGLRFNKDKLAALNLPSRIATILEYGSTDLPPFPHIRASLAGIETIAADIAKKRIGEELA